MSEIPLYENTEEEDWVSEDDAPDGGDQNGADAGDEVRPDIPKCITVQGSARIQGS